MSLRSVCPRIRAMLAAGSVMATLSGCSGGGLAVGDTAVSSTERSSTESMPPVVPIDSVRVELRFGDELVTATLADTPAAQEFAAMLPLELDLHDPMGQAKSGPLPRPLDLTEDVPVFDPGLGQLYYWAPSDTLAIFYEDFGQSIPDPGLVRLGSVDIGIDWIANAGNDFTVVVDVLSTATPDLPDR